MIAMAITQIHAHRRNRHGSWRDGEGGTLDASRPLWCILRRVANATLRLPGAPHRRRCPAEHGALEVNRNANARTRTQRLLSRLASGLQVAHHEHAQKPRAQAELFIRTLASLQTP